MHGRVRDGKRIAIDLHLPEGHAPGAMNWTVTLAGVSPAHVEIPILPAR